MPSNSQPTAVDWKPTIAVIGAGAVGGYYGARLAQHGHEVHFLLRGDYKSVRRGGWVIRSCDGDFTLPPESIHVYNDVRQMPAADLVIVALKCASNSSYEPLIRPLLKSETIILTLQNGLGNEERLAELFGAERVFGGLCFVCINRVPGGGIHHMDYGFVKLGEFVEQAQPSARLHRLVELFVGSGIKCEALTSLKAGRWEKLIWNIPFSGLGAALGLTTDRIIGSSQGLELVRSIMAEIIDAAAAWGVKLDPGIIGANISRTKTMGAYKSSMQIDREQGRAMEAEAILGEPVRAAERAGVRTPRMSMLYKLVKMVEMGKT